eukprot:6154661-Amphidinium_carterae.2
MSDGATRWQLHGRVRLMAQSALGTGHALRKWLVKYGSHLAVEGKCEIETNAHTTDLAPTIPGLITKGSAKRIQRAAENGRVGAAWRQLWSYGIAPSTSQTMQSMLSKWKTMPQDPCPSALRKLPQITSARVATLDRLHKASQRLKNGTALDAIGWTWLVTNRLAHRIHAPDAASRKCGRGYSKNA